MTQFGGTAIIPGKLENPAFFDNIEFTMQPNLDDAKRLKESLSPDVWNTLKQYGEHGIGLAANVDDPEAVLAAKDRIIQDLVPGVSIMDLAIKEFGIGTNEYHFANYLLHQDIQKGGALPEKIVSLAVADVNRDWGLEDDEKQHYVSELITIYAQQVTADPEEQQTLIEHAQVGGNIRDAFSRAVWGRPTETKDPRLEEARRVGRELFRALHPELWNEIKNIGVEGMILAGRVYRDHGAAGIAELLGTRNRIIDDVLDEVEDDGEDLDDPHTQEGVIADVKRRIMETEKDLFKRGFLRHSALSELAVEFK